MSGADATDVAAHRERLRAAARASLGMSPDSPPTSLRAAMRAGVAGWYPLVALGLLVIVDELFGYAFTVLAPELGRALGITPTALSGIVSLKLLAVSLAALPMAAVVQRRPWRASVSIVTAFVWSAVILLAVVVAGPWGLVLVIVLDGASTGSVRALHTPLLLDSYPADARVRAMSAYAGAAALGSVAAPLAVAVFSGPASLTWRGVFLVTAIASFITAFAAIRLHDPGVGRFDEARVRAVVAAARGEQVAAADAADPPLRFAEVVRRLLRITTIRRALAAQAMLGVFVVPFGIFLQFFLDERWHLDAAGRGVLLAGLSAVSLVALRLFGPRGEALFRRDPARLVRLAGLLLVSQVVCIVVAAVLPVFALVVAVLAVAFAGGAVLAPALAVAMMAIVPPQFRPHLAALAGIYLAGIGGFLGALLLGTVDRRFGATGALVALAIPGVLGAAMLVSTSKTIDADLDAMLDSLVEDEELREQRARGERTPLLTARAIDVAYGRVQVLFDVDVTVDEGEIVALLGTNGAGKSTLLRAIAGLTLPTRGSVRVGGRDITWLDAERRLAHGITMIPGGRSTFGPLSVSDNLRVFGRSLDLSPREIDAAVESCFAMFPSLAVRRDRAASVLSGGERQMLALSKAVLLRPKLLLVDELSLGLAPAVVGDLLQAVRRLNADGTAVLLVEQSLNVAAAISTRAYFLERGRVRFEGSPAELAARPDLARAVFLGTEP